MSPPSWAAKLKFLPRVHIKGRYYRIVREEDSEDILSTGPSFAYGGRYNKSGEFGALYLCDDPRTCNLEKLRQVGGKGELLPPQALGIIEIDIPAVVDLTAEKSLKSLGVTESALIDLVDRTLPQAIGEAAHANGIHALLVQSAVAPGKNLVIFDEALTRKDCRIRLAEIQKWKV